MALHKETCVACGTKARGSTWESWLASFNKLEKERDKNVHIVRVMKPIIDVLADLYFEPTAERGVCGHCDAGGGYYEPDRHAEDCPALVAWRLKPMMDRLLLDDTNKATVAMLDSIVEDVLLKQELPNKPVPEGNAMMEAFEQMYKISTSMDNSALLKLAKESICPLVKSQEGVGPEVEYDYRKDPSFAGIDNPNTKFPNPDDFEEGRRGDGEET